MENMTPAEVKTFLMGQVKTGKLATVRADGRPHVVPVWFTMDGDDLLFNTWHTSVKAKNMQRDPRVCICVDDEAPPFSFVQIEGTVTFSDDLAEIRHWATEIGGRYMGAEQAQAFGERNGVPGELLVRVTPTKILAKKNVSA
ncbi:MAG: PPOX class F420-dependent oxidoreductase [Chloroflexi bacterium]|nr:MAG: PPOX class F420-dependent oxidoreductase [Chloroflexota bacterium]